MKSGAEEINKNFYNEAYSSRITLIALMHTMLSYDQQSKSSRNFNAIQKIIDNSKSTQFDFLDFGFGHGSLILKMPAKVNSFGAEIAEEAVHKFNRIIKLLGRRDQVFITENLNSFILRESLDLISCSHVLEHVDDESSLIQMFRKLLKPGGHLLINLPINEVWKDPKHVRTYTAASARSLLEAEGFIVKSISEEDRITAFILSHETTAPGKVKIFRYRILRLLITLLPHFIVRMLDRKLSENYLPQQLIISAIKK